MGGIRTKENHKVNILGNKAKTRAGLGNKQRHKHAVTSTQQKHPQISKHAHVLNIMTK